jgi:E2F/DP family winged-helix DNA-binding domain.
MPLQLSNNSNFTTPSDINTPRINKGLKILSKKIREILMQRGKVSYKEISENVVNEMDLHKEIDKEKEAKNVLRRIYDSLNVLEACGVVGKSAKNYY